MVNSAPCKRERPSLSPPWGPGHRARPSNRPPSRHVPPGWQKAVWLLARCPAVTQRSGSLLLLASALVPQQEPLSPLVLALMLRQQLVHQSVPLPSLTWRLLMELAGRRLSELASASGSAGEKQPPPVSPSSGRHWSHGHALEPKRSPPPAKQSAPVGPHRPGSQIGQQCRDPQPSAPRVSSCASESS